MKGENMEEFILNLISGLIGILLLILFYLVLKIIICVTFKKSKPFFEKYQGTILISLVASGLCSLVHQKKNRTERFYYDIQIHQQ